MSSASRDEDAVWPATVFAATLIAQQVAAKATRDALFLSTIGVAGLPTMLIAAGIASLVLVPVSSRIMSALGPARLVPAAFVVSGLLLAGEWLFAALMPKLIAEVFYLQVATLNAIMISWFWSMMSVSTRAPLDKRCSDWWRDRHSAGSSAVFWRSASRSTSAWRACWRCSECCISRARHAEVDRDALR